MILANSDYAALLATIREYPNDDLPRLVAADWLEEHDFDKYAEFIRVQCELHRRGIPDRDKYNRCGEILEDGTDVDSLIEREEELWSGGVSAEVSIDTPDDTVPLLRSSISHNSAWNFTVVRRGFVEELRGSTDWFFGEPCDGGRGGNDQHSYPDGSWVCSRCDGCGRVYGKGAMLVQQYPILRVVLRDANRFVHSVSTDDGQYWFLVSETWRFGDGLYEAFESEAAAVEALEAAAIPWAKQQAEQLSAVK